MEITFRRKKEGRGTEFALILRLTRLHECWQMQFKRLLPFFMALQSSDIARCCLPGGAHIETLGWSFAGRAPGRACDNNRTGIMGEFYFPEATFSSVLCVSSHHGLFASSQWTLGHFVVSVGHNSPCFVLVECNVSLENCCILTFSWPSFKIEGRSIYFISLLQLQHLLPISCSATNFTASS